MPRTPRRTSAPGHGQPTSSRPRRSTTSGAPHAPGHPRRALPGVRAWVRSGARGQAGPDYAPPDLRASGREP
eukprot:15078770-Alexandrium_andersonii.AAC.1